MALILELHSLIRALLRCSDSGQKAVFWVIRLAAKLGNFKCQPTQSEVEAHIGLVTAIKLTLDVAVRQVPLSMTVSSLNILLSTVFPQELSELLIDGASASLLVLVFDQI